MNENSYEDAWFKVPNRLIDWLLVEQKLPPIEGLMLLKLSSLHFEFFPTKKFLAESLGVSKRTVYTILMHLQNKNLIKPRDSKSFRGGRVISWDLSPMMRLFESRNMKALRGINFENLGFEDLEDNQEVLGE